jgi:hypothetical protein
MDIEEVGQRVLQGMLNDELFIFTHREFREGTAARCEAMLAAYPNEPINEARLEAIRWLTSNSIYKESMERSRS